MHSISAGMCADEVSAGGHTGKYHPNGRTLMDRVAGRSDLDDDEAMALAVDDMHAARGWQRSHRTASVVTRRAVANTKVLVSGRGDHD